MHEHRQLAFRSTQFLNNAPLLIQVDGTRVGQDGTQLRRSPRVIQRPLPEAQQGPQDARPPGLARLQLAPQGREANKPRHGAADLAQKVAVLAQKRAASGGGAVRRGLGLVVLSFCGSRRLATDLLPTACRCTVGQQRTLSQGGVAAGPAATVAAGAALFMLRNARLVQTIE